MPRYQHLLLLARQFQKDPFSMRPWEILLISDSQKQSRLIRRRKTNRPSMKSETMPRMIEDWLVSCRIQGLVLSKVRIMVYPPQFEQHFHIDEKSDRSVYRLIVPLSSQGLYLDWKSKDKSVQFSHQFQAKESFLINVSKPHRLRSRSKLWRFFLVATVDRYPKKSWFLTLNK